jgi:hypothetical protein
MNGQSNSFIGSTKTLIDGCTAAVNAGCMMFAGT